ncbi:MAG TPA: hypothetical protein VNH11_07250 [Pirellulales bacterium]|nr:hypothetical protein [Pirellulales bacterium]
MADDHWQGDRDAPKLDTLAAVKVWLDHAVAWVRSLKGTRSETAAMPLAARTIRNFYRALDRLGVCDRPPWPSDPADVEQAEAALSDLLVWVRRHLPKPSPYSGCTLFAGEGIRTLGNLRTALLSEQQRSLPADMFQQCSGDQERALQALKAHQELTGDFRSFPIVQRADAICRQRYGQQLTQESLDRIRLEYHEKTGEPFGAVNNERLRDVLDLVEQIPLRTYPVCFAGLPELQPPSETDKGPPATSVPATSQATDQEPTATGAGEQGEGTGEQFIFARDGDGYFVKGFGESGHVKGMVGFNHVAKLIAQPGTPILMTELLGAGDAAADQRSRQPAMDAQAKRQANERLQELEREIDDAKACNDAARQERAMEEKERYVEQLKAAAGVLGKDRDINSQVDKHRPRILGAVKRACDALRKSTPPMIELANHFQAGISTEGDTVVYRAGASLSWRDRQ